MRTDGLRGAPLKSRGNVIHRCMACLEINYLNTPDSSLTPLLPLTLADSRQYLGPIEISQDSPRCNINFNQNVRICLKISYSTTITIALKLTLLSVGTLLWF